jgi:hypothetical protein
MDLYKPPKFDISQVYVGMHLRIRYKKIIDYPLIKGQEVIVTKKRKCDYSCNECSYPFNDIEIMAVNSTDKIKHYVVCNKVVLETLDGREVRV